MGRKRGALQTRPSGPQPKLDVARAIRFRFERGLTYKEIGKLYGVKATTVQMALKPYKRLFGDEQAQDKATTYRRTESFVVDRLKQTFAENLLDPSKIRAATIRDLGMVWSKLFEASRLLNDQSTANIGLRAQIVSDAQAQPWWEEEESEAPLSLPVDGGQGEARQLPARALPAIREGGQAERSAGVDALDAPRVRRGRPPKQGPGQRVRQSTRARGRPPAPPGTPVPPLPGDAVATHSTGTLLIPVGHGRPVSGGGSGDRGS